MASETKDEGILFSSSAAVLLGGVHGGDFAAYDLAASLCAMTRSRRLYTPLEAPTRVEGAESR